MSIPYTVMIQPVSEIWALVPCLCRADSEASDVRTTPDRTPFNATKWHPWALSRGFFRPQALAGFGNDKHEASLLRGTGDVVKRCHRPIAVSNLPPMDGSTAPHEVYK
jgi:hypothetical protein